MLKSMTGFGRAEVMDSDKKITVELKSVNHRYLDMNVKMPKKFSFFEAAIRNVLKKYIQRGKVDVFISYEDYTENRVALRYNKELAGEYLRYLNAMAEDFQLKNDVEDVFMTSTQNKIGKKTSFKIKKENKNIVIDCFKMAKTHVPEFSISIKDLQTSNQIFLQMDKNRIVL